MKISVSMTDGDVLYVDEYARRHGVESRSGVLREALQYLRATELAADYEGAFTEDDGGVWSAGDWDVTVADGLDASR